VVLAVAYFLWFTASWMSQDAGAFDEFIPAVGARLLLSGRLPHSGFWSLYPAGAMGLDAVGFALFGQDIRVQRALQVVIAGCVAALLIRFLWREHGGRPLVALAASLAGLAAVLPGSALLTGFALSLAAVLVHFSGGPRWAGPVLAALALLFRINFGAYAVIAILAGSRDWKLIPRFAVAGGAAGFVYWAWTGFFAPGELARQLLIEPARLMAGSRFLPLEGLWPVAAAMLPGLWFAARVRGWYCGVALAAAGALGGAAHLMRSGASVAMVALAGLVLALVLDRFLFRLESSERAMLVLACCGVHYYFSRADPFHAVAVLPAVALLLPYLRGAWIPVAALGTAGILFLCVEGVRPVVRPMDQIYGDRDEAEAVRFVQSQTRSGDPVFTGLTDHSRTFANSVRTMWRLGRPVPVFHHVFEPGITTREEVQRRMVDELESAGVQWMVLTDWAGIGDPGFFARKERGAEVLDSHIRARFTEVRRFGRYQILKSRRR